MPTANAIATVNCTRCNGSGQYNGTRRDGTEYTGRCFACQGYPRHAARRYAYTSVRQALAPTPIVSTNERGDLIAVPAGHTSAPAPRGERNWHDFATRYPSEAAWLQSPASGDFGASLIKGCRRYGGLTPRQLAAVQRNVIVSPAPVAAMPHGLRAFNTAVATMPVAQAVAAAIPHPELTAEQIVQAEAERASASILQRVREVNAVAAPIRIEATRVRTAMDAAAASGLRKVRLVLGAVTFKLSGASWRNGAGMILCYENGSYAGYIDRSNVFHTAAHRTVTGAMLTAFGNAALDPEAAARTYGRDHGRCACCQRALTDPVSIMQSMGPICARRWGWSR